MRIVTFADSWAGTTARATAQYGERGRQMALCLRAMQAGSKRIIASLLVEDE